MTRARAFVGAVPQRVWTAVAGLALLASLAVAAVIGAGLSVWRSAVGSTAEPPQTMIQPPSSGLVVLPGQHPRRIAPPPSPQPTQPTQPTGPTGAPITPVTVPVSVGQPGGPAPGTPLVSPPPTTDLPRPNGGGFGSRVGGLPGAQLPGGEPESKASPTARAAHLRHVERVAERRHPTWHKAKHAKTGGKHAAKRHGRHARED